MNKLLFSHVPLAMASCPQLLACLALCKKNPLLEEHTFPCAQGIFSRNILMKKFTCIKGGQSHQSWKTETRLAKNPPALQGDPDQVQTLGLTLFGPRLVQNLGRA